MPPYGSLNTDVHTHTHTHMYMEHPDYLLLAQYNKPRASSARSNWIRVSYFVG